MFIERIPNRNSPPCILLRETFHREGKVQHRTIANLSKWPPHVVEGLRRLCKAELSGAGLIQPSLFDEKNLAEPTPQQARIIQLLKNHMRP